MARKNIFDVLGEKIDTKEEIDRLEFLCEQYAIVKGLENYTLENFVDIFCLECWKNRSRCVRCEELRCKLDITNFDITNYLNDNMVLIYLEYLSNMIWLCDSYIKHNDNYGITQSYVYLRENLKEVIDGLGYEMHTLEEEEKVLLVEKNAAATAVAEIVEPELAYEVIEYNHHLLKGDIESKQKILKVLADKFEPMRSELKKINKDLESNTGYLLNKMNIRHNNVEGKNAIPYVQNLSRDELEEWYDETYQMLLLSILEFDNIERNKKVKELKKEIDG